MCPRLCDSHNNTSPFVMHNAFHLLLKLPLLHLKLAIERVEIVLDSLLRTVRELPLEPSVVRSGPVQSLDLKI